MKLFLLVLVVFLTTASSKTIREKILSGYDKYTRPVTSYKSTTNLSIALNLIRCELGEDGVMDTYSWLKMLWKDDLLTWDPTEFGGQDSISIPSDDVWLPDITLYNTADVQHLNNMAPTNVLVDSNGNVLWVPPFSASTFCDVDYTHWPFDKQMCIIKLGSWTRDNSQLALKLYGDTADDMKEFQPGMWELTDISPKITSTIYPCCPGQTYDDITYTLQLKRNSVFDRVIATVTSLVVCFTTLASFWISPKAATNKIIILATDILITTFVLFNIRGLLPYTAGKIPHVVIFYTLSVLLQSLSILITIITTNLASKKTPVPARLRKLHSGLIGKMLCMKSANKKEEKSSEAINNPAEAEDGAEMTNVIGENNVSKNSVKNHNSVKSDWQLVAIAIDRIFFQWLLGNVIVMYALYL